MKKLLIAAALTGLTTGAFAQGTVFFNNNGTLPAVDVDHTIAAGGTYAPANGFTVALYWVNQSSGAFATINLLTATPVITITGKAVGGFDNVANVVVNGQTADGTGEFEVAGWLGTTFTSYHDASVGGQKVGNSQPFYNATGGANSPPDKAVNLTGWNGQQDLVLTAPEPTTIALGGLGAAALLLFRRRK